MSNFLCPQCGAALNFTTKYSVSTVCTYCQSLVVRQDLNLELLGKEAILQDDMNPIQIGTRGQFLGSGFSVIGGVRLNHHEGFWQEWFLRLDQPIQGSQYAWLVQAQGEYQFLLEPIEIITLKASGLSVGTIVSIPDGAQKKISVWSKSLVNNSDAFQIIDSRIAEMTHFLGELPWAPDKLRKRTIMELASTDDAKMTIEYHETKSLLYFGRIMSFEELKFQNLKEVKGW